MRRNEIIPIRSRHEIMHKKTESREDLPDGELYLIGEWRRFAETHQIGQKYFLYKLYQAEIQEEGMIIWDLPDVGGFSAQCATVYNRETKQAKLVLFFRFPYLHFPVKRMQSVLIRLGFPSQDWSVSVGPELSQRNMIKFLRIDLDRKKIQAFPDDVSMIAFEWHD